MLHKSVLSFILIVSATTLFSMLYASIALAGTTTYVYDELDRIHIVHLADGSYIVYEYDEIGNMTSKQRGVGVAGYPLLAVEKAGTGSGTVTSPSGISCGSACANAYAAGTQIVLTVTPDSNCVFTGWSGGCTGTGGCTVTLSTDTTVIATFTHNYIAQLIRDASQYINLQTAFNAAAAGDTILSQNVSTTESLNLNSGNQVTLNGGYDTSYTNVTGTTTLVGTLTISNGQLTVNNLTIQ